jgi:hypothetical protein
MASRQGLAPLIVSLESSAVTVPATVSVSVTAVEPVTGAVCCGSRSS